jgi:tripartite-type tricarboxylate transporter receptor subunit TctC
MVGVAANLAVAPHLLPSAAYNPSRAFEPIGFIQRGPYFIVVRGDLPVSSLQELIAYSKANPQKLNFATPGMGTVHHLT